jgi:hypothetical protein
MQVWRESGRGSKPTLLGLLEVALHDLALDSACNHPNAIPTQHDRSGTTENHKQRRLTCERLQIALASFRRLVELGQRARVVLCAMDKRQTMRRHLRKLPNEAMRQWERTADCELVGVLREVERIARVRLQRAVQHLQRQLQHPVAVATRYNSALEESSSHASDRTVGSTGSTSQEISCSDSDKHHQEHQEDTKRDSRLGAVGQPSRDLRAVVVQPVVARLAAVDRLRTDNNEQCLLS